MTRPTRATAAKVRIERLVSVISDQQATIDQLKLAIPIRALTPPHSDAEIIEGRE